MRSLLTSTVIGSVFLLSIARAYAVQISLSKDSIDRYFQILEQYVLPLMVVSTVVLFCGYLASRIFHRTTARHRDEPSKQEPASISPDDGTEAFLRELTASPPIEEAEARREPKIRSQHPLFRRRAASLAAQQERPETATQSADVPASEPTTTATAPASTLHASVQDSGGRHDRGLDEELSGRKPAIDDGSVRSQIPRLQAAFRRPDKAGGNVADRLPPPSETPRDERIVAPPRVSARSSAERPPIAAAQPARDPIESLTARRPARADRGPVEPPPIVGGLKWRQEAEVRPREEPTGSVLQALNRTPPHVSRVTEAAKARAGEIVDSLDYIASVLQQGSVLLAEQSKKKQRLTLEDVTRLRISGFDEPKNVLEDLRTLGGDAPEEVLAAYSSVERFNNIVRRLEQMAEPEPLDEGWNDLVRARISETIFKVGQVRKTLGNYRRSVKKPANARGKRESANEARETGTEGSVPIGRRQI